MSNNEAKSTVISPELDSERQVGSAAPAFSKAPWTLVRSSDGDDQCYRVHAGKWKELATVWLNPFATADGYGDGEANARLVAAAPTMYAALELALVYIKGNQLEHAVVNYPNMPQATLGNELRAALALADTGKEE